MKVPSLHSIWKCYCDLKEKVSNIVIPEQLIATGPFTGTTAPTSWWANWSPIRTANQPTETRIDWAREHAAFTSPDVVTDFSFTYDLGVWYNRVRRARRYLWVDYRIKFNGTVVLTRTNQRYMHKDHRTDTNPDVINPVPIDIESIGSFQASRLGVPPNTLIEIETRVRDNINGAQPSAWARVIGGLRSTIKYDFTPRQIVIGRQ